MDKAENGSAGGDARCEGCGRQQVSMDCEHTFPKNEHFANEDLTSLQHFTDGLGIAASLGYNFNR
jgi:hypothetical protein